MRRHLLILMLLLVSPGCGEPPMGIVVIVSSDSTSVPLDRIVPRLFDEAGANVELPFECFNSPPSQTGYQYANREMYQYSGRTISLFLTSGDDSDRVEVASVNPKERNLDIFNLYLGGSCPSESTINLSSYQGSLCTTARSADTSWK